MPPRRRALSLPHHAQEVLRVLFPALDLPAVRWIEGIPRPFRVGESAITLGALSPGRLADVFFAPGRFDATTCTTLALLVHEAAHVEQVRRFAGGRGIWLLRAFYAGYVAQWIHGGFRYERIRFEREAFALADRFLAAAREAARARPDLPLLSDGLPDPAHPDFPRALAASWHEASA